MVFPVSRLGSHHREASSSVPEPGIEPPTKSEVGGSGIRTPNNKFEVGGSNRYAILSWRSLYDMALCFVEDISLHIFFE